MSVACIFDKGLGVGNVKSDGMDVMLNDSRTSISDSSGRSEPGLLG